MGIEQKKPFVLIVDDVEANRYILRDVIEQMDCIPLLAESGEQALKYLEHFKAAIIILDITMPVMDGFELCQIVKENPQTRDIPVIFISALDDQQSIVRCFKEGGADYIVKPFLREVVKARVGVHLNIYKTKQELQALNSRLKYSIAEQILLLEEEKKKVLYTIVRIARENASYDENHMERLGYNCRIMAEAMQLSLKYEYMISEQFIETIEIAAPLCDIGNMSIPVEILRKKDRLNAEEKQIVCAHTTAGARLLHDINEDNQNDFVKMSEQIALCHHENYDGSGYPSGLKGDEIPLAAQIVSIIGSYCAMTERRTYRDAYSIDDTIEEMERESGNKFSPDLVDILKRIKRQFR